MHDPFVGTWTLNPSKSHYDANHRPSRGTLRFQREDGGAYLMLAEGADENGQPCEEKPQRIVPDGQAYPVPDMPGLQVVTTRPDNNTLRSEARRQDGSIAGEGTYAVSPDGTSLTATTAGFDTQLRRFEMKTVWDRG